MSKECEFCEGTLWVCEEHHDKPFEHDDCGGAGDPCPECNDPDNPEMPPGTIFIHNLH